MKLALGTVQFGLLYGINNKDGIPTSAEVAAIFDVARQHGINTFDTASLYGDAEFITGEHAHAGDQVITKFKHVTNSEELLNELNQSLLRLKRKSVYGFMAHDPNTFISRPDLWKQLTECKNEGLIQKAGYSLYSLNELERLLDNELIPDIIQVPYSVFDRKFEPVLNTLKKAGTEIHVRSVFLQGLYFMDTDKLPAKLLNLKPTLEQLNDLCNTYQVSKGSLVLNYAASNPLIDKVVIGVETAAQLKQNIAYLNPSAGNKELTDELNRIKIDHPELLIPSNW